MKPLLVACTLAAAFAGSSIAAPRHGFHDPAAPALARRILLAAPGFADARCVWKIRGVRIGCVATYNGQTVSYTLWPIGPRAIMTRACIAGVCKVKRAAHLFGRPY